MLTDFLLNSACYYGFYIGQAEKQVEFFDRKAFFTSDYVCVIVYPKPTINILQNWEAQIINNSSILTKQ